MVNLRKFVADTKAGAAAFSNDESGVVAIEYGLIAALVAVAIICSLSSLGHHLKMVFWTIDSHISSATDSAASCFTSGGSCR